MEEKKISVKLTGPAKIGGIREPAGKTVRVAPELARELASAGVIARLDQSFDDETPLASDFEAAVEAAVAVVVAEKEREIRAEVGETIDQLKLRVKELNEEAINANQEAVNANRRAEAAVTKLAELEAQIAASSTDKAQASKKSSTKA